MWARHLPPAPWPDPSTPWQRQPEDVTALTEIRRGLRAAIADGALPAGSDDGERLQLVVEELVSNALRHGRRPVQLEVTAPRLGWLVVVRDAAGELRPSPAFERDPADGGMGLSLVARICRAHGWVARPGGGKVVWARVPYLELLRSDRARQAADRAVGLVARLTETAAQAAQNLEALAAQAEGSGRSDLARQCRSAAVRVRLHVERAHWAAITAPDTPARHPVC